MISALTRTSPRGKHLGVAIGDPFTHSHHATAIARSPDCFTRAATPSCESGSEQPLAAMARVGSTVADGESQYNRPCHYVQRVRYDLRRILAKLPAEAGIVVCSHAALEGWFQRAIKNRAAMRNAPIPSPAAHAARILSVLQSIHQPILRTRELQMHLATASEKFE